MSVLPKIEVPVKSGPENEMAVTGDPFEDDYPGIFEVLCRQSFQGEERQTGRLILFSEPGRASLCLVDKQSGQVAFYTAGGFTEALEGLEKALQAGKADWRKDKRSRQSGRWG